MAIPKLDTILKDAESQRKEALAGKAADPDRAEAFNGTLISWNSPKPQPAHIEYLKVQAEGVGRGNLEVEKDLRLAANTWRTVDLSLETADLIRRGSEAFGALMTLELPHCGDLKARNSVNGSRASNAGWPNRFSKRASSRLIVGVHWSHGAVQFNAASQVIVGSGFAVKANRGHVGQRCVR